jgi:hypothetical protein
MQQVDQLASHGTSATRPPSDSWHLQDLIDIGAHPKAMSERMGHTEIGVTMNVYGHIFEGKQRELTRNLDDLLDRTRSSKRPAGTGEETDAGPDENDAT